MDPAAWRPGHALLGAKCLGAPELLRCGLVTGAGVVRDGIQVAHPVRPLCTSLKTAVHPLSTRLQVCAPCAKET